MANDPPFATLNQFVADLGIPESQALRGLVLAPARCTTRQQLDRLNPAIMAYITHLHVATAGFVAATAIALAGLAWYGVRNGLWWALITGVISPVLGLAVALPLHWMGHFNYDWVSHLGPIYLGTIIYVVGVVVALIGLTQGGPAAVRVGR
jgi:hypothetical protein